MDKARWWQGRHGEAYVLVQMLLLALVAFGPRTCSGLPAWPAALAGYANAIALPLLVVGLVVATLAAVGLGANLTPLPHPRENGSLVDTGLYGLVRHPIYFGLILAALGWALHRQGWLSLLWAVLLGVLFDRKSRREEHWLLERHPAYAAYRLRVKRLIPFIY